MLVGQWEEGHTQRLKLIEFLTASGGLGTTLDIRRYEGYDGKSSVLQYLNQPEVKVSNESLVVLGRQDLVLSRELAGVISWILRRMPQQLCGPERDTMGGYWQGLSKGTTDSLSILLGLCV